MPLVTGRKPVLDDVQAGRDQEGRHLPGLHREGRHPLLLPRGRRQPGVGVQPPDSDTQTPRQQQVPRAGRGEGQAADGAVQGEGLPQDEVEVPVSQDVTCYVICDR